MLSGLAPIRRCFIHHSRLMPQPRPALPTSPPFPKGSWARLSQKSPLTPKLCSPVTKVVPFSPAEEKVTSKKTLDPKGEKVAARVMSTATWVRGGGSSAPYSRVLSILFTQQWLEVQALLEILPEQQPAQLSSLLWAIVGYSINTELHKKD